MQHVASGWAFSEPTRKVLSHVISRPLMLVFFPSDFSPPHVQTSKPGEKRTITWIVGGIWMCNEKMSAKRALFYGSRLMTSLVKVALKSITLLIRET